MKGIISWFARNGVAANLLMIIIAGAGLFSVSGVKKEIFPEFSLDIITIQVAYPRRQKQRTPPAPTR